VLRKYALALLHHSIKNAWSAVIWKNWRDFLAKLFLGLALLIILYFGTGSIEGNRALSDHVIEIEAAIKAAALAVILLFSINLLAIAPFQLWREQYEQAEAERASMGTLPEEVQRLRGLVPELERRAALADVLGRERYLKVRLNAIDENYPALAERISAALTALKANPDSADAVVSRHQLSQIPEWDYLNQYAEGCFGKQIELEPFNMEMRIDGDEKCTNTSNLVSYRKAVQTFESALLMADRLRDEIVRELAQIGGANVNSGAHENDHRL
jgi:hypothetical protein